MKTIKISELPLYQSLKGLFTIGTDSNNRSVKVPLEDLGGGGSSNYPPAGGIPASDLADGVIPDVSGFATKTEVVKSITVNGQSAPKDPNGNVNIEVQGGGETVVINSDGANIVDGQSNSILTAPSSRMVKEIYLNLQKLFDPVNGLANIAFVGQRPTWQSVAIPTHTITLGTMNNVSASIGGDAISGSTPASEGEVTILLTPSGNNYMGSISVKDGDNNDVAFTQTDVAGGTEITFILSGNVTINASASSGIQVNVSGTGITSYTTGVQPDIAAQLTIALPEHHTWGTVTVAYGGTDITSQCTISQANNADKVITLPVNLSDMSKTISIVANAVEEAHAVLNLTNVGSGVTVNKANNAHLYVGDSITIIPASGNKVTASATVGGNAATLDGDTYAGYSYTIGANDVSANGTTIAITATATGLNQSCQITLPATGSGIASAALTDLNGTAISSPVVEGTGIKIVLTPDTDYTISIGTITMNNVALDENTDYTVSDNNDVKTIAIQHVTGSVIVSATASQPTRLYLNLKWFEEPSNPTITEGQRFTLDLIPLTDFVAAATQDAGTENAKPIRAAVEVTMNGTDITNNTGVVTYDETNNKVTINIANPSGNVSINATARLTLKRNSIVSYRDSQQGEEYDVAVVGVVPVPKECLPVISVRRQYDAVDGITNQFNNDIIMYRNGVRITNAYWSIGNDYKNGGRTIPQSDIQQYASDMNGFKCSFQQSSIDAANTNPGVYVNGEGTDITTGGWIPALTKDDLLSALHVD